MKWDRTVRNLLVVVSLAGSGEPQPDRYGVRVYAIEDVPESLESEVKNADAAIQALQAALIEALTNELRSEGPLGAIHVCRDQAQAITARVAREQGIDVGRTSHRLRNPANRPRPWSEPFVSEGADKNYDTVQPRLVDLGERVGVIRPINTLGMCTQCHGNDEQILPEVREAIAAAYPEDRATGFGVGDLRGWIWAEVPKSED